MALSSSISAAILAGFNALDDLKKTVTYSRVTGYSNNISADTVTLTKTDYTVTGVLCRLSEAELGWFPADTTMQKFIVLQSVLGFKPELDDYVTISGVQWEIKRVNGVPGESIWVCFLNRP